MVNRKSSNATFLQHGSIRKRILEDKLIINGRKRNKNRVVGKASTKKRSQKIKPEIKTKKPRITKNIIDGAKVKRIASGVSKVQVEELKKFIKEVSEEGETSIIVPCDLKEFTQNWLFKNGYNMEYLENLYTKSGNDFQPISIKILIYW